MTYPAKWKYFRVRKGPTNSIDWGLTNFFCTEPDSK